MLLVSGVADPDENYTIDPDDSMYRPVLPILCFLQLARHINLAVDAALPGAHVPRGCSRTAATHRRRPCSVRALRRARRIPCFLGRRRT